MKSYGLNQSARIIRNHINKLQERKTPSAGKFKNVALTFFYPTKIKRITWKETDFISHILQIAWGFYFVLQQYEWQRQQFSTKAQKPIAGASLFNRW